MSAPLIGDNWRQQLSKLGDNWDGHTGSPIAARAMDTLEKFSVVPLSDGGLQLEAHRDGFDIEVEVGSDGKIKGALVGVDRYK